MKRLRRVMGPILVVSFLVSINYKREDRQNGKAVVFSSRPTGSLQTQQLLNKRVFLGKPISGLDTIFRLLDTQFLHQINHLLTVIHNNNKLAM